MVTLAAVSLPQASQYNQIVAVADLNELEPGGWYLHIIDPFTRVRDMAENFKIEIKSTADYSPWSNGLLE